MKRYPEYPGHRGQDTSIEAAEALSPYLNRLQKLVHSAVDEATERRDGCTTIEAANALGRDHHEVGKRITELQQKGSVKDSGRRRLNPSGRKASVWITVKSPH